jgi:hypothetical protein
MQESESEKIQNRSNSKNNKKNKTEAETKYVARNFVDRLGDQLGFKSVKDWDIVFMFLENFYRKGIGILQPNLLA